MAKKSRAKKIAIKGVAKKINGVLLPQRVLVLSESQPIKGSSKASINLPMPKSKPTVAIGIKTDFPASGGGE